MEDQFARTRVLLGEEKMRRLTSARVALFGLGGVGGYVLEALARSGIGTLDLIDNDVVSVTNLNRQILATWPDIGRYKTEVARERVLSINPDAAVHVWNVFYTPQTSEQFDFSLYDYVVDAIDTVTGKLMLAEQANKAGVPLISCMGTGNKMDAAAFEVADIYETRICPLARVMRRELKKRGIDSLKVVYSPEEPLKTFVDTREEEGTGGGKRRGIPGSNAFVPASAGLLLAGEVIRDLTQGTGGRTEGADSGAGAACGAGADVTSDTAWEEGEGSGVGAACGEGAGGALDAAHEEGADCLDGKNREKMDGRSEKTGLAGAGYPERWCW